MSLLPKIGRLALFSVFVILISPNCIFAADTNDVPAQLRQLQEQNRALQEQLREQGTLVKRLNERLNALEQSHDSAPASPSANSSRAMQPGLLTRGLSSENVVLSGEGGLAFFHQGSQGQFRNAEFRVDEAKVFLDAKIWDDVYLFAEGNIFFREQYEDHPELGELYVDFENVSRFWGQDRLLNVRLGRIDIPFGEEYLSRDAIDNPLISRSLSDLWGVDEGIELYGRWKKLQYVLAVQNGGHPMLHDGDADKAIITKIGYDPAKWLHLSVSAMRTGNLDVAKDGMSELWFSSGFVRQLGSTTTTTKFHADLVEGDAQFFWRGGHVKTAGGGLFFDDNDTTKENHRDVYYYYVEASQDLIGKLYGVARWSQIFAPNGYPLVGAGNFASRFYGNTTTGLQRLSVGLGYRWNRDLLVKIEYSLNRGRELGSTSRRHEDFFGAEVAIRF
jgi:hypothetical protein